ncbi:MAG: FIST N-terminal domain-containing protein, partial [Tissierellia bacterium]|nr:FIST N-terminal domain-containing protein [Tissierellia bacterium]
MGSKIMYFTENEPNRIASEMARSFKELDAKFLLYFASSNINQEELSKRIKEKFTDTQTFGCSTAGELISGKMLKNSVVAMAFDSDTIEDLSVEVIEEVGTEGGTKKAFETFENRFGRKMTELEFDKYIGIVLVDGISGQEENLMEKIGMLTNVNFVGGSAGDDLKFEKTFVH